jgi:hypothetical protein
MQRSMSIGQVHGGRAGVEAYLPDSGHFEMPPADMDLYLKSIAKFVAALP